MTNINFLELNIKVLIFLLVYIVVIVLMEHIFKKYVFINKTIHDQALNSMFSYFIKLPILIIVYPLFSNVLYAKMFFVIMTFLLMLFNCYKLLKIDKRYAILCFILFTNFLISGYFIVSVHFI